jgi:glycosyltransferase involved in cell wall biosynthesis
LRIDRSRIDVVPRGRDPERLGRRTLERRDRARAALGVGADTPVVLAAARHEYQKGLDVLLESFAEVRGRLPAARLFVAGRDGNQSAELAEIVARDGLGGSVTFLGPRSDVEDLMCAADVFAMPSRWEGLGSVVLEAMGLEVPVVASDLGPVREVVGDDARLVPAEAPGELARAIVAALEDPAGSAAMADRAYQRFVEGYTIDRIADGMTAFYRRALNLHEVAA